MNKDWNQTDLVILLRSLYNVIVLGNRPILINQPRRLKNRYVCVRVAAVSIVVIFGNVQTRKVKETVDPLSLKLFYELCTNADEQQWKIGYDVKSFILLIFVCVQQFL